MGLYTLLVVVLVPLVEAKGKLQLLGSGQCVADDGKPPTWIKTYGDYPKGKEVKSLNECQKDCNDNSECTATGFSNGFNACILYNGGPYTKTEYWSMYTNLQCYTYGEDDEL